MGDVFSELIGQERAVAVLRRALEGKRHAMTHAWLFVGPPGSGRSNAAKAFAAALQCKRGGCGDCEDCRTTASGAHPDVTLLRTEQLSIGVDEVRELVGRANVSPVKGRYQIVVIEDADRITERGADALLKGLEEPAPRTVWLLCAPSPDDVIITIRSRSRVISLVTPGNEAVAALLERRDGIQPALAAHAARVAQGHVGRARMLARNEDARIRRREILALPGRLTSVTACLNAAQNLVESSALEATQSTAEADARELAALQAALGVGVRGAKPRNAQAAIRELEEQQKARTKRLQRDALDRVLTELTGYYRDVLATQTAPGIELVNADLADEIGPLAGKTSPEQTVHALDAILKARTALEGNVAPLLALEALLISLSLAGRP
ncbi:DNA polymerase-3 subunit delta' [Tessaracoccus bendigoensis DSM 12906]|uniref:DNA polymerase-3 subunit delta n=1 Tax=Tessaracoccus bendigoensis DSM 12906 TaxID=1123357 RepID=A0A1M6H5U3_9ACTN|nr:DNA polymerase III subunit delta' [Tessaracoccus bendigoensis]SHJ17560.1 DNA polymerase-3 subunit delta' [Tessaracoccus bendigoensis DSM 12906]